MLVRHSHIDTFLQAAQVYLEKDEALNNLMLGIALRIQRDPNFYQRVEMFTLNEGADQILAALVTVPEKLIIYSTKGITAAAVEQLVLELLEQEINVPGVIGPKTSRAVCRSLERSHRLFGSAGYAYGSL